MRGEIRCWAGQANEGLADLERAIAIGDEDGGPSSGTRDLARGFCVSNSLLTGDTASAVARVRRAVEGLPEWKTAAGEAFVRQMMGAAYAWNGQWDDAERELSVGLAIAERSQTLLQIRAELISWLALTSLVRGDLSGARQRVNTARE